MLIFLGWSGDESKAIALALESWLKMVCQAFEPWISESIEKGVRWSPVIASKLRKSQAGVFVLTPGNLKSTWLHFEAGAISNVEKARVCTFLRRLTPAAIGQPLGDFQHTQEADRADMLRLVKDLWNLLPADTPGLKTEPDLEKSFGKWWPDLVDSLAQIPPEEGAPAPGPNATEMTEQILGLVREMVERDRRRSAVDMSSIGRYRAEVETLARGLRGGSAVLTADQAAALNQFRNDVLLDDPGGHND